MADVKWIKLTTNIFENRKIRQIEGLPDGDAIIVIWVKLLCLAGNINDSGMVYFTKEIPYTDQMLATQFNRPLATIQLALKTFEQFEMLEVIDNVLHISNWEKYQNIEGMDKIREQNRLRQQRFKQKKLASGNVTDNVTLTLGNATDIDIDIDIEEDKDKDINIIINYLNEKIGSKYRANNKATQQHINARLKEGYTVDDFKTVIDKMYLKWKGTEYEDYLRPQTLFGTKFESYLNSKGVITDESIKRNVAENKFFDFVPDGLNF